MTSPPSSPSPAPGKLAAFMHSGPVRGAIIYFLSAIAWIMASHAVLPLLVDESEVPFFEILEDGAFAIFTGALLFQLLRRHSEERAHIEAALRRNEKRYRSLVLATANVSWTSAPNGEIIEPLPTWEEFSGQRFEQYRGLGWLEAIHPDDRAMIAERWRKAVARETRPPNNRYYEIEYRVRRHDGAWRQFVNRTVPVLDSDGSVQEWVGVSFDISEQKAAEQQLRASENRFQLVTRATTDIVYDWDMVTNAIWWNENLNLIFGYVGRAEDLGIDFWIGLLHPEDAPRINDSLFGAISAGKQFWADEYRFRRCDGSYANVLDRGYIMHGPDGKPARMIGAMMDITERKLNEQRLRDSREQLRALTAHMEKVREEERTRIAREIHDELGQALTGLKMDLAWCGARLPHQSPLQEKSLSMVRAIDSTVEAVRRLSTELRPAILDNLGLIPAIEWLAQDFQKRSGVPCEFITPEDNLPLDDERATALFRIAQEALTNVARYAGAKSVQILLEHEDGQLLLRIRDNGRGITDEQSKGGHSFGLLGMRERAHLLGGTFDISGKEGHGTTLTVRIPLPQTPPGTP